MKRPSPVKVGRTIEWTTIPVWYLYVGGTVIVAIVAVGGFFIYQALFGPKNGSERAIRAAETAYSQASQVFRPVEDEKTIQQAEVKLEEARKSFGRDDFQIARVAAEESERLSREIIEAVGAEAHAVANFKRISGRVEVKKASSTQWIVATPDTALGPNDLVRTDNGSRAEVLYNNGTNVVVEPSTLIQVIKPDNVKDVTIEVPVGNVIAKTGRIGKNLLKATDGTQVEVAPTTVAQLTTGEKDGTEIKVDVGTAVVKRGDQSVAVESRQGVKSTTSGLGQVEALPERPKAPGNLQIFEYEHGDASHAVVRWEPVGDATEYVVEMGADQLLTGPDVHRLKVTKSSFELEGYPDGDYFWRVVAVNAAGKRSVPSEIQAFHIGEKGSGRAQLGAPVQIPSLQIKSATPYGTTLIVQGMTDPNVRLSVDGEAVSVKSTGEFYSVTSLREDGKNEVVVTARNAIGGVRKTTIIVVAQFF